jgi:diguanylate cyclase (GGDEF)-like protein
VRAVPNRLIEPPVTTPPRTVYAQNPLHQLPSVLALPDLKRRLERVLAELPIGEKELVALLKLDPLAVIRGLRASHTIVFRRENTQLTVPGIVNSLGPTLSKRLFRQPTVEIDEDACESIQQLWRHSIATAHAASELAKRTGMIDQESAYLLGLLHDLPEWFRRIELLDPESEVTNFQSPNWLLHWQLPAPLVSLILAINMGDRATSTDDPPDPPALIRAAELLAELAGFRHPQSSTEPDIQDLTQHVDQSELSLAKNIQRMVEGSLRSFGFDPSITEAEITASNAPPAFEHTDGHIDEIVVSILSCTQSKSYRGIITALTATAVRYGNYDRAFYAKWNNESSTLIIRSKADSSARRMVHTRLRVSTDEAECLRRALDTQQPEHLKAQSVANHGLLHMLSTDELLAIPLNSDFQTPAFLLLDRSLTLTRIREEKDMTMATMMGMTGSLLNQNLLLRRRRQRAQKFALTDPLTRLFNRRMGIHALEQCLSQTDREGRKLTILMCDLDHFKRLNDTLGHVRGDAALRSAADVLRHSVRKADTVCRYGGEEFLVVLPDTTPDEATVLAARMFTSVHARGEELGLPVTISIGLTSHRPGDTVESILLRADHALYASKDYGRNRFSADVDIECDSSSPATPEQDPTESSSNNPTPSREQ